MKTTARLIALAPVLACFALAAAAFDPVPGPQRAAYRFDLRKNFYADEAGWNADADKARLLASRIAGYRGRLLASPQNLLAVLESQAELTDLTVKLFAYGEFRSAVDTSDTKAMEDYKRLKSEVDARLGFLKTEMLGMTAEKAGAFFAAEPRLLPYRYRVEDTVRLGPHALPEAQEALLAALEPALTGWQHPLYRRAFDRTDFLVIWHAGQESSVVNDYETLMKDPDRAVRERAFRGLYAGLASIGDLAGFALVREMGAYNAQAKLRGFSDYYDESLFRRYLTPAQVDNLYAQIEAHLPLYREYLRAKMERTAQALGLEKAEIWDMEVPLPGHPAPRYTADEGVKLVEEALEPLGENYAAELARLLDPKNGKVDLAGGQGRAPGAFCEGYFGFFMSNYQGFLGDVSTMAHEGGHGVYYQLLKNRTGSLLFGDGPKTMSESYSMLNEWLLRDYLMRSEKDPERLEELRLDALDEMMVLFELARRAKFERVAYARVAAGEIRDEKGMNRTCLDVGKAYDPAFERYPEMASHWLRKHHYWSVPTYYLNYVIAHVLALKYYQLYLDDPKGFPPKYVAMVAAGFDRPPEEKLEASLGIDLNDPNLLEGAFKLMEERLAKARSEDRSAGQ